MAETCGLFRFAVIKPEYWWITSYLLHTIFFPFTELCCSDWGKCDNPYCLIVFVVLIHMHCLHEKCRYLSSWHVRCGTSRPTYANERNAQYAHMTEKSSNQAYMPKSPFSKILALEYSSNTYDRHATEIHVANTWLKGRSADYTWPQVLQWLNSTENHSTLYVLIGVSPPWNYASFLWRTY